MNKETKKKKKGAGGKLRLHTLWAKPHRFSAHVTEEQDWHTEVPNVRLARVFGIVLILHVVAVGGILAFKMIEKSSDTSEDLSITGEEAAPAAASRNTPPAPEVLKDKAIDGDDVNVIVDDPSRLGMKHYRVRSGDNLLAVARRLGVSVSELEELNKLNKGNELYAGQVLLVPNRKISALPAEDIQRLLGQPIPDTIIKAETEAAMAAVVEQVGAVAEKAGEVVMKATPIESDAESAPILKPVLAPAITPAPPAAPVAVKPVPAPSPVPSNSKSYVVQPGDTPYGIGRRFNVNPSELMRANGISDPRFLKVGAELRIP
jgi:LysM repeat protein